MIELEQYLKANGLESLQGKYKINVSRHQQLPLYLLKYNHTESPLNEPIVQQCRSTIIDEQFNVVARFMDKFFNYDDPLAATIDWNTASVYEKVDGSFIGLYWYGGWHICTSGSADARVPTPFGGYDFYNVAWDVWANLGYRLPEDHNLCYSFELVSPYNRVVVRYDHPMIKLIAVRNMSTGEEKRIEHVDTYNWQTVSKFVNLNDMNSVVDTAKKLDGEKQEGFVVMDDNFDRIKIKSPDYFIQHKIVGNGVSHKDLLEMVLNNDNAKLEMVENYYADYMDIIGDMRLKLNRFCSVVEGTYFMIKDIPNQKDFAEIALKYKFSAALFQMRKGTALMDWLKGVSITRVQELIGVG